MTTAERPKTRRRGRSPRPLAALIDEVLRRADADLSEEEAVHDLRVACDAYDTWPREVAGPVVADGIVELETEETGGPAHTTVPGSRAVLRHCAARRLHRAP